MSAFLFVEIFLHVTCTNKSGIADVTLMLARHAKSKGMIAAGVGLQAAAFN
jgi:hypothetical protein